MLSELVYLFPKYTIQKEFTYSAKNLINVRKNFSIKFMSLHAFVSNCLNSVENSTELFVTYATDLLFKTDKKFLFWNFGLHLSSVSSHFFHILLTLY